jgi:hypothetical protein
MCGRFYYLL